MPTNRLYTCGSTNNSRENALLLRSPYASRRHIRWALHGSMSRPLARMIVFPSNLISPESIRVSRFIVRSRVVLPPPLGPMMHVTSSR
jgi:hypothetical protein